MYTFNHFRFTLVESRSIDGSIEIHLELLAQLDREVEDLYDVVIVASDGNITVHTSTMTTRIQVTDVNDNAPMFIRDSPRIEIPEDTSVNTIIINVTAHDNDTAQNAHLVYSMTERSQTQHGHIFSVDPSTGAVSVQSELDYESSQEYSLFITVRDGGMNPKSAMTSVNIVISDINDCIPEISVNTLTTSGNIEVYENSLMGTFVAHVSVSDADSGDNGDVRCSVVMVSECDEELDECPTPFLLEHLHRTQYKIVTAVELDREEQGQYELQIQCHDQGIPNLKSSVGTQVYVLDRNDHYPRWRTDRYLVDLQENNIPQKYLIQVAALDDDIGRNARISYDISGPQSNFFTIDSSTGLIRTSKILDHEQYDVIMLTLTAIDDAEESPLSSTTQVQINILDMNDEMPLFSQNVYNFNVDENLPSGNLMGVVSAVDLDGEPYNTISYGIEVTIYSDLFTIDSRSGHLRTTTSLDREAQDTYHLTIIAFNPGFTGLSSSAQVIVQINDLNDNWPVIISPYLDNNTLILSPDLVAESFVYHVIARDDDLGANAELSYSIIAGDYMKLFQINNTTGIITTITDLKDADGVTFELIVQVDDGGLERKVTFSTLSIEVKIVYLPPLSFTDLTSQQLLILAICFVVVFVFFFFVLTLALIYCRRRHRSESVLKESESMLKVRDAMSASTTQTTIRHSDIKQPHEHTTVFMDGEVMRSPTRSGNSSSTKYVSTMCNYADVYSSTRMNFLNINMLLCAKFCNV